MHPIQIIRESLEPFNLPAEEIANFVVGALHDYGMTIIDLDSITFYENELYGAGCTIASLTAQLEALGITNAGHDLTNKETP